MKTHPQRNRRHLGLALSALLTSSAALAQGTWDGGGTTNNFSDAANWVGDVAPTTNGLYTFAGTTRLTANNNLTLTGADNTLTFDSTAGAFTITGSAIRMGAVNNNSSNLQTISVNLRLNGGRTINTGSAGVNLTTLITSTGASGRTATKTGSGDLIISATGTSNLISYSASAGRLVLGNATGTLTLPSTTTTALASGTSLVFAQAGTAVVDSPVTGAGSVRKTGLGTSTLSGLNTYTGGTVVDAGVLTISNTFTMAGANGFSLAGAASPVAGTDYGSITASAGTFTYGGDLALSFSGTAVDGASYNLFNFTGATVGGSFANVSIGGSYTSSLTNSSGVWTATTGGFNWTFTESTGDLVISSAVPEPSTFAAIVGVLGLSFAASRRRRKA